LLILGLTKTTLLDYPEKVAATVFTGGCNFRCPFCHNGQIVLNVVQQPAISENEVIEHLIKRKSVLEGVCITGGEPTIQADLPDFIEKIKKLGYLVKLDTNGSNPKMLKQLIDNKMIDYVAMDIKNTEEKYPLTTGIPDLNFDNIKNSYLYLMENHVPYEFRTTVIREYHTKEDLVKIGKMIKGAKNWFIQSYKFSENVIAKGLNSYSKEELQKMTGNIKDVPVMLRGLD